jgi:hypothetical protein
MGVYLGSVLGGVADGFAKEQANARQQRQFDEEDRIRQANLAAMSDIQKHVPKLGDKVYIDPNGVGITPEQFQSQYGPANATPGSAPTFTTPEEANTWAATTSSGWKPPPAPAAPQPQSGLPAPNAAPPPQSTPDKLDPDEFIRTFTFGPTAEGTALAKDSNGAPVRYGINQAYNPSLDVAKLNPDQAASYLKTKYWDQSGAASMPPALAAVHFDTYMLNPSEADKLLKQSNGDPNTYMALREKFLSHLEGNAKYAPYKQAWDTRNAGLKAYVGNLQSGGTSGPPVSGAQAQVGRDGSITTTLPTDMTAQGQVPSPKDFQAYRTPDGKIMFTNKPHSVNQDDIDQFTAGVYRAHGLTDQANATLNQMYERQAKETSSKNATLALEHNQLLQAFSRAAATGDLQGIADVFNASGNGHYVQLQQQTPGGPVDAYVYDQHGRPSGHMAFHSFSGGPDQDGNPSLTGYMSQALGTPQDLGTYYNSALDSAARANQAYGAGAESRAVAASTNAETQAGLPGAKVAATQGAAAASTGAAAASQAEAAERNAMTQDQVYTNQLKQGALGVLSNAKAHTPDEVDQANATLSALRGSDVESVNRASINGLETSVWTARDGSKTAFDAVLGQLVPWGDPAFPQSVLEKDPDLQAHNIEVQRGLIYNPQTKQSSVGWRYVVAQPGNANLNQQYKTISDAKAALKSGKRNSSGWGLPDVTPAASAAASAATAAGLASFNIPAVR